MAIFRVLIIDPSTQNSEVIAKSVRSIGHLAVQVKTGAEAIGLLSTGEFDCFILNLTLALDENDDADIDVGIGFIEQIRNYRPNSLEYPIIIFGGFVIDNDLLNDCMEAGANRFLSFNYDIAKDKREMSRITLRLINRAIAKRSSKPPTESPEHMENIDAIHKKLAAKHKLVVDLKAGVVFFNGIILPSGKDGLQPRHNVFLFILARNLGKAMSSDEMQAEIRKFRLDEFTDPSKNIRNQIRSTLRKTAKKYPGKITEDEIKAFLKTIRYDLSRITLDKKEVFTIYGKEAYT